jgi:PhnB protein
LNKTIGVIHAAPEGWHTVTPRIVAHDAGSLVEFICQVIGAEGSYDPSAPTILAIGDSKIMVSDAGDRNPHAAFLYVYVGDADSVHGRALEHGSRSIEAPFLTPYGDRRCMFEDPWGNTWQVAVCGKDDGPA